MTCYEQTSLVQGWKIQLLETIHNCVLQTNSIDMMDVVKKWELHLCKWG